MNVSIIKVSVGVGGQVAERKARPPQARHRVSSSGPVPSSLLNGGGGGDRAGHHGNGGGLPSRAARPRARRRPSARGWLEHNTTHNTLPLMYCVCIVCPVQGYTHHSDYT